jgi:hypothetical protein
MIAPKYSCKFGNGDGVERIIVVDLPADEIERAGGREIVAMAYALRHAYSQVPNDFRHHDVTPMWAH